VFVHPLHEGRGSSGLVLVLALVVHEHPVRGTRPHSLLSSDLGHCRGRPIDLVQRGVRGLPDTVPVEGGLAGHQGVDVSILGNVLWAVTGLDDVGHVRERLDTRVGVERGLGHAIVEEVAAELPEQGLEFERAGEDVPVDPLALNARGLERGKRLHVAVFVGGDVGGIQASRLQNIIVDVKTHRSHAPRDSVLGSAVVAGVHEAVREVGRLVSEGFDDVIALEEQALGCVCGDVITVCDGDVRPLAGFHSERHLGGDVAPLERVVLDDDVLVLFVELVDQLGDEDGSGATCPTIPEADRDCGA